ncbi:MAG: MFS transporter [Calditrichaeota bacterium]|nr:MFS transporter [Calditrichota bacterium]
MKKDTRFSENRLATYSWILYDFANTIYSMNVVTMYFSTWIVVDLALGDQYVSFANSMSMLIVALTMPILGEISDRYHRRMPFLIAYTLICVTFTALIGVAGIVNTDPRQRVQLGILFFIIANYTYQGGLVFYNALLPTVTSPRSLGRVSGYGVAIGYLGSIMGLMFVLPFVEGAFFGVKIPFIHAGGSVAAFIPSAILFLIFALPAFVFIKENTAAKPRESFRLDLRTSFKKIWEGISNTRKYPGVRRFLIAKFFYEDAIQTIIIFMAVYAQKVMGFSKAGTTEFFIVLIPSAIVGSAIFGILTDHFGPQKTLTIVLLGWIVSLTILIITHKLIIFWITGAFIGIFMGSTWTAARPLLISLVPKEMLGEFFGLYSLSGKIAAIFGPIVWATAVNVFAKYGTIFKYKAAIGALTVMIVIGLILVQKVPNVKKEVLAEKI